MRVPFALAVLTGLLCSVSCAHKKLADLDLSKRIKQKTVVPGERTGQKSATGTSNDKYAFKRPKHVKGIYITAWTAGTSSLREPLFGLIDRTELNAVVIDVRDVGQMYFKTGIPLADECHATTVAVPRPEALFDSLMKHGIWPIARIACFKDAIVPLVHSELAVQTPDGKVWKDRGGKAWLDPYNRRNWEYLASTVDFALNLGFPEIQLDYVRFPSEGAASSQRFPSRSEFAKTNVANEDVVAAFAAYIGQRVRAHGAVFSADVFGIISSTSGDEGIGQQLEKVAQPFDLLCPMVYPSHFAKGEYGIDDPALAPYDIVKKSIDDYKRRLPKMHIRPWLQAFSLGAKYGPQEIRAQIKATRDVGYRSFLLWNAKNKYGENIESALAGKERKDD
ncbi:MAG: putative glycoside hydrolase [Fimbriimonas sp.]|nr:putative glycoside hydrolase [Fimbriimonas sp.]